MGKLLRVLEKVGLVESESAPPMAADPAAEPVIASQAPVAAEPVPDGTPVEAAPLPSGERPFDQIYAEQALPAVPFSAEKLLRVLDGLAALDPGARKAAVQALDAADDAWAIDDVLGDAERKKRALEIARRGLEQQARLALESAREAIAAREARQQEATTRIRQQIADLAGELAAK